MDRNPELGGGSGEGSPPGNQNVDKPDGSHVHVRTVGRRAVGVLKDTPVEFKVEVRGVWLGI